MSEANVELARAAIDAFNRGDLEWLLERIDDDFVFDWTRSRGPLAGIYRGRDGLAEFLREQWETFESFVMEPTEFIDRGRYVVVPNTVHVQGRNGIEASATQVILSILVE
jgi:ketosteroid isomerase-like protein